MMSGSKKSAPSFKSLQQTAQETLKSLTPRDLNLTLTFLCEHLNPNTLTLTLNP